MHTHGESWLIEQRFLPPGLDEHLGIEQLIHGVYVTQLQEHNLHLDLRLHDMHIYTAPSLSLGKFGYVCVCLSTLR